MLTRHIALVSQTKHVNTSSVTVVAAAVQKQVNRDFGPLWQVDATVSAFDTIEAAPIDYWHVVLRDDINRPDALGFHKTEANQPIALIQFDDDWSITASHEILEMLADPFGDAVVAGDSLVPNQGRVLYLQEICDPCKPLTYKVNEIVVSDFCTPHYYDPRPAPGVRYDYLGGINAPRQILKGGYLAFLDPVSQHVFQQQWFDTDAPVVIDLNAAQTTPEASLLRPGESLRGMVDRLTPKPSKAAKSSAEIRRDKKRETLRYSTQAAHAAGLQQLIDDLLGNTEGRTRAGRRSKATAKRKA